MPRIGRVADGGRVQHVLNRGNGRMKLFNKRADYAAFVKLLGEAGERVPGVRLLGFCLMPNHWHLLLWPRRDGELSAYMSWLSNTHVRRWRQHWHSVGQGHVYQGRFKNFLVQNDEHLLTVLRYIEANPLRVKLVKQAEDWAFSSLRGDPLPEGKPILKPLPVQRPADWVTEVNAPLEEPALTSLRESVIRGRPYGSPTWVKQTATKLGLQFTLRPRGRPRKKIKRDDSN